MLSHLLWRVGVDAGQGLFLLVICCAFEQVAAIERFSLRQRIPGAVFQLVGGLMGGTIAWSIHRLWLNAGASGFIVPLYDWLKPLPLGGALYFAAMFVVTDFLIYWRHRAEHRWFWPIHAVHHSPRELHAANDIGHPLQTFPDLLMVWLPMSLVQMPGPATPVAVSLLTALLTMYIHSPIDFHFGPLRQLIIDNRFHRIHHSLEPRHFDRNFGVGLTIWDRVFGTAWWPAPQEWPKVGVDGIQQPRTVVAFLMLPVSVLRGALDQNVGEVVGYAGQADIDTKAVRGLGVTRL